MMVLLMYLVIAVIILLVSYRQIHDEKDRVLIPAAAFGWPILILGAAWAGVVILLFREKE